MSLKALFAVPLFAAVPLLPAELHQQAALTLVALVASVAARRPLWRAARACPWIGYILGMICAATVVWLTHDWRAGAIVLSMALMGSTLIAWWERRALARALCRHRKGRPAVAD
jgi:hypothetical protein